MSLPNRLSRTLPSQAVRLAHEPLVGLHYLASHSQQRTSPTLAAITRANGQAIAEITEATHDARDVSDAIAELKDARIVLQKFKDELQGAFNTPGGGGVGGP